MPSAAASVSSSPTFAPSARPTAVRPTLRPTPSPEPADDADPTEDVDPTPYATSKPREEEGSVHEMAPPPALPTSAPAAAVRAFRTPERDDPPAFVAPEPEAPGDEAPDDQPTPQSMAPMDREYIATVTFHTAASTDVDGFELLVIYPLSAGDFIRGETGVDCKKTGNAMLFADDRGGGTLHLLVASNQPITFPFDIVCRFTVAPNAALPSRLIAVNVLEVVNARAPVESSALTVTVSAY
jgi:hypothetical protein